MEKGKSQQISTVLLFIIPKNKHQSHFQFPFEEEVVRDIKSTFGRDILLAVDICLCSHTVHGHCGVEINKENINHKEIDNDATVKILAEKSLLLAAAGADIISPSDMMDDRVLAIRQSLNQHHFHQTMIMSYSTKFSSSLYGPFREAAQSTPSYGDRKTYQLSPGNPNDAIRCSLRDAVQGADILMVKPAGMYLDIIRKIKDHPQTTHFPLCAYQVSGEYQSLWLMHQAGYLSFQQAYLESLVSIKRAGADMIITYGANEAKEYGIF